MTGVQDEQRKPSLFTLIATIPALLSQLVRDEIESLKHEVSTKLKHAGIGIGLLVGAGAFAFFALGVLVAAAILGIATVIPGWAAALIVAAILLLITAILVSIGIGNLKKGVPPAPTDTIKSVKKDVIVIKGTGKRAQP